jgi:hypothetical protein
MRGLTLSRRHATPLADLSELARPARQTVLLRFGLALALALTLAGAVLLARAAGSGRAAVLPTGAKTGVIALDMSASVAGPDFERVATVLHGFVVANQPMGIVMFSDVAYELLPPSSPPSAMQQFVRFFSPQSVVGGAPQFGQTLWDRFSGGTRISSGLIAGQKALRRAHAKHGSIVLLGDLDDSQADLGPLQAEALALRRAHIPVRIVPLSATAANIELFTRLFGPQAFVPPQAFTNTATRSVQAVATSTPWALLAVGVVLIVLLAANERFNSRLVPETSA